MTTFFTSDQHFGHARIIEFGRGNGIFNSIKHHDKILRDKWWETITSDDDVYVVGDVAMGDLEETIKNFLYLPGTKYLIPGNHDAIFSLNSKNYIERHMNLYVDAGFIILPEIVEMNIETTKGSQAVLVSHFPYAVTKHENVKDKFKKVRPVSTGKPLIHGHTHFTERFNPENKLEFHVGVDANDFAPVPLKTISSWLETLTLP